MFNKTGIYKITNKSNNKFYFGSSQISFKKRWQNHTIQLDKNNHGNNYLQAAWNKHGKDNFEFKIILLCDPGSCLYYEQLFLDRYWDNCVNCYNINPTAGSSLGYKHSDIAKEEMSKLRAGKNNPMFGRRAEKSPAYGKKINDKTKQKISKAKIGKYRGDENPASKLSNNQRDEIVCKYKNGGYSYRSLAAEYNIEKSQIHRIIKHWN